METKETGERNGYSLGTETERLVRGALQEPEKKPWKLLLSGVDREGHGCGGSGRKEKERHDCQMPRCPKEKNVWVLVGTRPRRK